jgi:hypothetical protein
MDVKQNLEYYKQTYFETDEPVPFLNFKAVPVATRNYYDFFWAVECLTMEKNKDPEGVSYSYLDYLIKKADEDLTLTDESKKKFYYTRIFEIIKLCLGIEYGIACDKCGHFKSMKQVQEKIESLNIIKDPDAFAKMYSLEIGLCPTCQVELVENITISKDERGRSQIKIKDCIINKKLFDEFRTLVCYQNMIDYNDDYIDPVLEEELKAKEQLENKGVVFPSLEKQMCCVATGTGYTFEYIKKIPLRKFILLLSTIDAKLHYQIYKLNENSGAVKFPEGINHWIYEKKRNLFDDMITLDSLRNKIKGAST